MYSQWAKRMFGNRQRFIVLLFCGLLGAFPGTSFAQDTAKKAEPLFPPPPYVTAEGLCVSIGVQWDEAAVKKLMPAVLKPSTPMIGAINICTAQRGLIAPMAYANFDVELEASPLTSGYPGTWQALGIWGPNPAFVETMRESYGPQIQLGEARITETKTGYRAVGLLNGKEVVAIEVKVADEPCQPVATTIDYVNVRERTGEIILIHFPVAPDICNAEPISAKVTAVAGNELLAALQPKELLYAIVGKNAAISWGAPITVGWAEPTNE